MNFFPQPCEFPRVSGHPLHHGMTNQNGQGQVLGGQAPSESVRLGAKQGHAKSATHNVKPQSHPAPIRSGFHAFILSRLSTIQHPRVSVSTPYSCRGLIPRHLSAAFSLTEVVIAMGVAAVAFTSIIALFPLGLNMSKDSYDETQSALIAQTILSDLKDQQTGSKNKRYTVAAGSPYSYKLIQIAGNVDPQIVTTNYLGIDLRLLTQQNVYLAYDAQSRKDTDTTSQPIMLRPSAGLLNTIPPWYSGTTISNGLAAVVKVTFVPTFSITTLNATTGVLRVDISIETPGSAKPENRTVRLYTGAVVP